MNTQARKLISIILAVVLIFQLFPFSAMAAEEEAVVDLDPEVAIEPELAGIEDAGLDAVNEQEAIEKEEKQGLSMTEMIADNEIAIIGEDITLREENTKQFYLENGMMMATVYPHAVHYQENGVWVEIDNRLQSGTAEYVIPSKPGQPIKELVSIEKNNGTEEAPAELEEAFPENVISLEERPIEEFPELDLEIVEMENSIEGEEEELLLNPPSYEAWEESTKEIEQILMDTAPESVTKTAANSQMDISTLPESDDADNYETEATLTAEFDIESEQESDGILLTADNHEAFDEEAKAESIDPKAEEFIPVTDTVLKNSANSLQIALPESFNENNRIIVSNNGYELSFRPAEVNASRVEQDRDTTQPKSANERMTQVSKSACSVIYKSIYEGIDLKYDLVGKELKESYIIAGHEAAVEKIDTIISAPDLTPVLHEDGSVEFLTEEKELEFFIPAPMIYDAEYENGKVYTKLFLLDSGEYMLSYYTDMEWLSDKSRVWPVTLDPTITTIRNASTIEDTYIESAYPNGSKPSFDPYNWDKMKQGNEQGFSSFRSYVRLTSFPQLKSSQIVVDAKLSVYVDWSSSVGQLNCQTNVYTVLGNTELNYENLTWNAPGVYDTSALDVKFIRQGSYQYNSIDVTRAVRGWYDGSIINNGIVFRNTVENTGLNDWYYMYTVDTYNLNAPYFTLVYFDANGVEDYWDYTSQGIGRAGTASVQDFSGNFVVQRTDLDYSGSRMPAPISFTYNLSDKNTNIGYGNGWRMNYCQTVSQITVTIITDYNYETTIDLSYYEWVDSDGTSIYFASNNGVWKDESGFGYTLTVSSTGYTITDKKNNRLIFDSAGRLIKITDSLTSGNNYIQISYNANNKVSQVKDGAGRKYNFSYSSGLLTSLTYVGTGSTALDQVTYYYNGNNLVQVTYTDGKSVNYAWSGNQYVIQDIMNSDNTRDEVTISCTATNGYRPSRTTGLTYRSKGSVIGILSFEYGENTTKVIDQSGRFALYHFNNYGNTTSVYNNEGKALYGRWAKDESSSNTANQLVASSRLQYTSNQPILTAQVIANGVTETINLDNRCNLINDMEVVYGTSYWNGVNTTANDGLAYNYDVRGGLDANALRIVGEAATEKRFTQEVSIPNGSNGDIVSFGGWVKCDTIALNSYSFKGNPNQYPRTAGIRIELFNGNNSVVSKYIPANGDVHYWQFLSGSVTANAAYTRAVFSFVYENNYNTAFFDGAQLFREPFEYIYEYDEYGNLSSVTDLEGRVTSYEYDSTNHSDITSITLPGGAEYTYHYNSNHQLDQMVTAENVVTEHDYDAYGNLIQTEISTNGDNHVLRSTKTYSSDGNMVASSTTVDQITTTYSNDTNRSLVNSVTDAGQTTTTYSYDSLRRPTQMSSAGSTVGYTYSDDKLTSIRHNNTANTETEYRIAYAPAGLMNSVMVGHLWTLAVNYYQTDITLNNPWTLYGQFYGNGKYWRYEYNANDVLIKRFTNLTDTVGYGFEYIYNSKNLLVQVMLKPVTISGGSAAWGNAISIESYVYDAFDRLVRIVKTDGSNHLVSDIQWTLDYNDNVTALTSRYVVNGTLRTQTYSYAYNDDQQLTQTTYDNLKETITYDGYGRRSGKTVTRSGAARLQTQYAYRNVDNTFTTEQIASLTHTYNNTTLTHAYAYDANGNILTDTVNGDTTEYTYDTLNRLTWEKNAAAELAWQYTYDLGGNILTKTEYRYVNGVTSSPQAVTYTYGDSQWPDLLTSWNGQSITYDGIGNPTNYMGSTMEWQGGRQLKSVTRGNNILTFAYNDSGLRTEKTVGHVNDGPTVTKKYVWNGSRLMAEIGPEYSFYFNYNAIGEMIGFMCRVEDDGTGSSAETQYIFVKNQQGDVEKVIRSWDQTIVASYAYDAWGNPIEWSGPMAERNPIRYRGYYYDTETGFYYLQSRYYDPQTGRFINADGLITTGQGLMSYNMFAYCLDNPVNRVDPNGTIPAWAKDMLRSLKQFLEETKEEMKDAEGTVGGGFNGSFGAGVGGVFSFGWAIDNKGNVGIIGNYGFGSGLPSASANMYFCTTNASSIYALGGKYSQSIDIGASAGEIYGGGVDVILIYDPLKKSKTSIGVSVQGGVTAKLPVPFEYHTYSTGGKVIGTNIYDVCCSIIDRLLA